MASTSSRLLPLRAAACLLGLFAVTSPITAAIIEENFDHGLPAYPGTRPIFQSLFLDSGTWSAVNKSDSTPNTVTGIYSGASATGMPGAQSGADYAVFDFEATDAGTISLWLISPSISVTSGATITFWTYSLGNGYADRLEVRFGQNDNFGDVGIGSGGVGNFDLVLGTINPDLTPTDYPTTFTQYSFSVPVTATGRFAFRYYIPDAGTFGSNGYAVGVDSVVITTTPIPEPSTIGTLLALAVLGLAAHARRSRPRS